MLNFLRLSEIREDPGYFSRIRWGGGARDRKAQHAVGQFLRYCQCVGQTKHAAVSPLIAWLKMRGRGVVNV